MVLECNHLSPQLGGGASIADLKLTLKNATTNKIQDVSVICISNSKSLVKISFICNDDEYQLDVFSEDDGLLLANAKVLFVVEQQSSSDQMFIQQTVESPTETSVQSTTTERLLNELPDANHVDDKHS